MLISKQKQIVAPKICYVLQNWQILSIKNGAFKDN